MASFNDKIYSLLKRVPKGKVTTYRDLAHAAGTRAYRAVGTAMKKNPYGMLNCNGKSMVPCHRVVSSDGSIGGFGGMKNPKSLEVKRKIKMLAKEGVKVKYDKIVDFEKVLYSFY